MRDMNKNKRGMGTVEIKSEKKYTKLLLTLKH